MDPRELVNEFHKQLDQIEAQGVKHVQISTLKSYLKELEQNSRVSQDHFKVKHESNLAHYAAMNQHSIEMLKAVLEAGKGALQTLLVINGGAAVAILGIFSNLAGRDGGATLARYLSLPLLQFGLGVLVAALGFAFRYFSQACYAESAAAKDNYEKFGDLFRYAAIFSALAGYTAFGLAVVNAYHAVIWSFAP